MTVPEVVGPNPPFVIDINEFTVETEQVEALRDGDLSDLAAIKRYCDALENRQSLMIQQLSATSGMLNGSIEYQQWIDNVLVMVARITNLSPDEIALVEAAVFRFASTVFWGYVRSADE